MGLRWLVSGKESTCNAGDMSAISDLGISHMLRTNQAHKPQLLNQCSRAWELQLLSPHAAATEATTTRALEPVCCSKRSY